MTQLKGESPTQYADIILVASSKEVLSCLGGLSSLHTNYYPETDTYRAVFDKEGAESCSCCQFFSKTKQNDSSHYYTKSYRP